MCEHTDDTLTPVEKMTRDLRNAVVTMTPQEARFLVDYYYQMQDDRKRAHNQVRAMTDEPHEVLRWLADQSGTLERQVRAALDRYSASQPMGAWAREIIGIGPVISAGLLAHIDITRAPTAGHIWRFAGQDPTVKWEKGKKRPWNASLKVLCWKIGESFVKVKGNPDAVYGQLYTQRREYEEKRNEAGELAEQAAAGAARVGKNTDAYKHYAAGKLPPGHIHARAKRWTVKIFLSHWHAEAYRQHYGTEPPAPYPIAILGHAHRR